MRRCSPEALGGSRHPVSIVSNIFSMAMARRQFRARVIRVPTTSGQAVSCAEIVIAMMMTCDAAVIPTGVHGEAVAPSGWA